MDAVRAYFRNFPSKLTKIDFPSGEFDLVLSLVVAEYLPYAPVAAAFEKARAERNDPKRKAVDDLFGEKFFYERDVRKVFEDVLYHHRDELVRLNRPNGLVLFSCWKREDEHQPEQAPEDLKAAKLFRVGDDRMTMDQWQGFLSAWEKPLLEKVECNIGPNPKSCLNLFMLRRK
jgi:hypothetical protein